MIAFERFETVTITPGIIKEAIDCGIINRLSFWDALMITAAESSGLRTSTTGKSFGAFGSRIP